MSKRVMNILERGQRGFTLIELVAVMAIMAVLVAVVAPSVTGTRNASIDAQTMQDATQVRSAATNFYKSQNEAEVRTPHSVTTTAKLPPADNADPTTAVLAVTTNKQQTVSSRWPERYITLQHTAVTDGVAAAPAKVKQIGAVYPITVPTNPADNIDSVVLVGKDGKTISGATFLEDYTAIDLDTLVAKNLLGKAPAGSDTESDGIPNFLWLFLKTSSSTSSVDDSREVVVFKLVKVVKIESSYATNKLVLDTVNLQTALTGRAAAPSVTTAADTTNKLQLTYERIF
ncbi:MAG: type II secretion system protein [Chloroflexi bacterium]|nr:type II secretion system protein [Chloroflexota bacterium]